MVSELERQPRRRNHDQGPPDRGLGGAPHAPRRPLCLAALAQNFVSPAAAPRLALPHACMCASPKAPKMKELAFREKVLASTDTGDGRLMGDRVTAPPGWRLQPGARPLGPERARGVPAQAPPRRGAAGQVCGAPAAQPTGHPTQLRIAATVGGRTTRQPASRWWQRPGVWSSRATPGTPASEEGVREAVPASCAPAAGRFLAARRRRTCLVRQRARRAAAAAASPPTPSCAPAAPAPRTGA